MKRRSAAGGRTRGGTRRFLAAVTWLYMVWSIVPVLIAVLFSFNAGRSRSDVAGLLVALVLGRPDQSVLHDPTLRSALRNSLSWPALDMLIAVPLGVALALGLTRWRGRGVDGVELPDAVSAGDARDRDGRRRCSSCSRTLYTGPTSGRTAQLLGHVTFSISYVVVDRARPPALRSGREYEEAARDLGASTDAGDAPGAAAAARPGDLRQPDGGVRLSIDDFVISVVPVVRRVDADGADEDLLQRRGTATPALNALATVMLVATLSAVSKSVAPTSKAASTTCFARPSSIRRPKLLHPIPASGTGIEPIERISTAPAYDASRG